MTLLDTEIVTETSQGYRKCEGCPRCQDSNAPWCTTSHPKWNNLHPVCKKCRHCVLNGSHDDDIEDLKET